MKHLVLIIHDDLKLDTADLLHNIEGIQGFTFSNVEGHGLQSAPRLAPIGQVPALCALHLKKIGRVFQVPVENLQEADLGSQCVSERPIDRDLTLKGRQGPIVNGELEHTLVVSLFVPGEPSLTVSAGAKARDQFPVFSLGG